MKVRIGPNRYVERPFWELLVEAILTPIFILAFMRSMRGGWGH